jgi:myo-inositol-1(or 4)-monophosphatase
MHVDAGGRQIVAANVRLIEPLQQTIVNTGYAKSFD